MSHVTDGAILFFNANNSDSYTPGSEVLNDLLGSTTTLNTNSGVATSLNDGGLDLSAGDNELNLSEEVTFRTISIWYKKTESMLANPLFLTTGEGTFLGYLASRAIGGGGYSGGQFFPTANVYVDGVASDIAVGWNDLPDGELHNIVFEGSEDVTGVMTINGSGTSTGYYSKMIFHSVIFYDKVLTAEELVQNFNAGSGIAPLTVTNGVFHFGITIAGVDSATGYRLTTQEDEMEETTALDDVTELVQKIKDLQPGTTYTVRLYVNTGNGYALEEEIVSSTLQNTAENHNLDDYGSDGTFDFTDLSSSELNVMGEVMNELFDTGVEISFTLGSKTTKSTFVKLGETVGLDENSESIVIPFTSTGGTNQSATLSLSDDTEIDVTYDESVVTIGGNQLSEGESIVLDGKKLTLYTV